MGRSHNIGVGNEKKHCERYRAQNRLEKNRKRKATKFQKFLAFCKSKVLKTPRGTTRRIRREKKYASKKL
jgi:hypothetical protein